MYLVSSAEGLAEEPREYTPFRLREVLERLAVLQSDICGDPVLEEISNDINRELAASPAGLAEEPREYGPLYLLELLERLAVLGSDTYEDPFLGEIASDTKRKREQVLEGTIPLRDTMKEFVIRFAKEARRRTTEEG